MSLASQSAMTDYRAGTREISGTLRQDDERIMSPEAKGRKNADD